MTGKECQGRDLARDLPIQIVKVNAIMKALLKTIALVALLLSLTAASSSSFRGLTDSHLQHFSAKEIQK